MIARYSALDMQVALTYRGMMHMVSIAGRHESLRLFTAQIFPLEMMRDIGFINDQGETERFAEACDVVVREGHERLSKPERKKVVDALLLLSDLKGYNSPEIMSFIELFADNLGVEATLTVDEAQCMDTTCSGERSCSSECGK